MYLPVNQQNIYYVVFSKKLSHRFLLWIFLLCILTSCTKEENITDEQRFEQQRANFLKQASCKPEKALSQGEIYAKAMQQYWQESIDGLFTIDKFLNEEFPKGDGLHTETQDICELNIVSRKIYSNYCYPWKISTVQNLEELVEKQKQGQLPKKSDYLIFVSENLSGTVYNPHQDAYLYHSYHFNQPTDFSILERNGTSQLWYANDCCTLITYKEYRAREVSDGWGSKNGFPLIYNSELENLYFLSIKKRVNSVFNKDDVNLSELSKKNEYVTYSVVNHCGKIIRY